jgi:hypothetical protein
MNAVEIEEAISALAGEPFNAAEFGFQFITAFGAKKTTVDRLRRGDSNQSDIGGVLQRNNIHIAVARPGEVSAMLAALRASPKTASAKAKFILATDGDTVEAEDLVSGDVIAGPFASLHRHFATFLPLAGISTVKEIKNNPVDIKATGRLNRLYLELLKDNPDWATEAKRPQLNQFMAQLIFCFFAEDTDIFHGSYKFTATVERMSSGQADDTQAIIAELFRAMGTRPEHRAAGKFPTWADGFPYVNGGYLFNGDTEAPYFGRTARAYLLRAGELDWKEINPDIFGSMIQAVADDGERGELGMHYTSVPNILKVLNPLFLDSLREQLEAAGDGRQRLRTLRKRLATIRVFDPACGSGNFLVIAYKEMRRIEATIVERLGGEKNLKLDERRSVIPLDNFYGIEIKGFAAEIARLALLIAEFQADCVYLSQQEARAMVLPLHKTGQITVGNALRVDWLNVCPPVLAATGAEHDLGGFTGRLALDKNLLDIGTKMETYICGNPPYVGTKYQTQEQKSDLKSVVGPYLSKFGNIDYVGGWVVAASAFLSKSDTTRFAFVSTTSLFEGEQAAILHEITSQFRLSIAWCHQGFKWSNSAADNAGVTCCIACFGSGSSVSSAMIYSDGLSRQVDSIGPYLISMPDIVVKKQTSPLSDVSKMAFGSMSNDGGFFTIGNEEFEALARSKPAVASLYKRGFGGTEFINGLTRYVLHVSPISALSHEQTEGIRDTVEAVRKYRSNSAREATAKLSAFPSRFAEDRHKDVIKLVVPQISSERRTYFAAGYLKPNEIVIAPSQSVDNPSPWEFALISSSIHMAWLRVVGGKLENRLRYSPSLVWNTFPCPKLTEQNKCDLTRTAENILLAREAHFPATIADLYDPETMPDDLRRAHDDNDEVLERIYIGRRFRNDTERLEKLFDLYTKMTADAPKAKKGKKAA